MKGLSRDECPGDRIRENARGTNVGCAEAKPNDDFERERFAQSVHLKSLSGRNSPSQSRAL